MITLDLVFVGFGNVGRRLARVLDEQAETLRRDHDLDCRIVGICTRRHGMIRDMNGLDGRAAAMRIEQRQPLVEQEIAPAGIEATPAFIRELAQEARATETGRLVVIETTVLDIGAGQPALNHSRTALECGAHVVTANKGPVAFAYEELAALAAKVGRGFFFEGAVMDGIPIFNLVRETLPAVGIVGFRGVVNSTTNYILNAMEQGREFAEALAEMQAAGIAESDSSLDVDGWDAAAKTAALANVLLGGRITPHDVARTGIGQLWGSDVRAVAARGRRLKLLARARRDGNTVVATVAPEVVDGQDVLATLRDQQNALVLETNLLGDVAIVQLGGGLTQTAYALMSDLVALRRRHL